jgi:hypothetical protein
MEIHRSPEILQKHTQTFSKVYLGHRLTFYNYNYVIFLIILLILIT